MNYYLDFFTRKKSKTINVIKKEFDASYYRNRYADMRNHPDPLGHYLRNGWRQGRDPNPEFSTTFYLNRYPDVAAKKINPFYHYLVYGRDEGRVSKAGQVPLIAESEDKIISVIAAEFDAEFYRRIYHDVRNHPDPLKHFVDFGWREGRDPNCMFCTEFYLTAYPDVAAAGINPFFHYLQAGRVEGRRTQPSDLGAISLIAHRHTEKSPAIFRLLVKCARAPIVGLEIIYWYLTGRKIRALNRFRPYLSPSKFHSKKGLLARQACEFQSFLTQHQVAEITSAINKWDHKPLISILMPVYNTEPRFLVEAINSVKEQLYPNWELCIADDASTRPRIRQILNREMNSDSRIRVVYRSKNGHISAASNSALKLVRGEFVALLDHDDTLPVHALFHVVNEILEHPEVDLIYSDEDKIRKSGMLTEPHFKPSWNEELFLSQNYINHLAVYRTSILRKIGGFRTGFEGSQDHDLALRFVAQTNASHIRHIPRILYHWRAFKGSASFSDKSIKRAEVARRKAVRDYLDKKGICARVVRGPGGFNRVKRHVASPRPPVSLIVPTRDRLQLTRTCIDGLLNHTDYDNLEVIIVDNDSAEPETLRYFSEIGRDPRVRILPFPGDFNYSAMNNFAVQHAEGEIIGLINNDIEVVHDDWLLEMVGYAVLPDVGAVGAKLLYPDNRIQHAGVILGIGGVAGHSHKFNDCDDPGYFWRPQLAQHISAVTGACMIVRKEAYLRAGGLDDRNLKVAFNDVDFCLKLRKKLGLKNVYTPYATLYHKESASRGLDLRGKNAERFQREVNYMKLSWNSELEHDPYYSPNLTRDKEDFSIEIDYKHRYNIWNQLANLY